MILDIFLFILLVIMLVWVILIVRKSELSIQLQLDTLESKAKEGNSIEELDSYWNELVDLNKKSWYKLHGTQIIRINNLIQFKYGEYYSK